MVGVETEYLIRCRPGARQDEVFARIVGRLAEILPTADGSNVFLSKTGRFLATGGAVWQETLPGAEPFCLFEGSTAEGRGARVAALAQRGQDRLFEAAARRVPGGSLIKANRDAFGNACGCHENFEADCAAGWRLGLLRAATVAFSQLLLGLPLLLIGTAAGFAYALAAAAVFSLRKAGREPSREEALYGLVPARTVPYAARIHRNMLVLMAAPLAAALRVFAVPWAFARTRRLLSPLLASRPAVCGAGWVEADGSFLVSPNGAGVVIECGFGMNVDRPLYLFGEMAKSTGYPPMLRGVLRRRQRLQVGCGDSLMCEEAEYLRLATVELTLDAIEAGRLTDAPRLRSPVKAIRAVSRDAGLSAELPLRGGGTVTALELQRFYWRACRDHAAETGDAESAAAVRLWDEVLTLLERGDFAGLFGRLDWVTKRSLLNELPADATDEARRKLSIRWHELAEEGGYRRLAAAGAVGRVFTEEEVERASRNAPAGTRAFERGRLIREFGDQVRHASWDRVTVRDGLAAKTFRLPPA